MYCDDNGWAIYHNHSGCIAATMVQWYIIITLDALWRPWLSDGWNIYLTAWVLYPDSVWYIMTMTRQWYIIMTTPKSYILMLVGCRIDSYGWQIHHNSCQPPSGFLDGKGVIHIFQCLEYILIIIPTSAGLFRWKVIY